MGKVFRFRRGIHPHEKPGEGKCLTGKMAVVEAAAPSMVAILLSQHVGAPCTPLVKVGDHVYRGQAIGQPGGFVSAAVHASISGTVIGIQPRMAASGVPVSAVVIENDGMDEWDPALVPLSEPAASDPKAIIDRIRECGIVGLGGACFPTHVKLSVPSDKKIDCLIANGAECEPYLTSDQRMMMEASEKIVDGLLLCARALGVQDVRIGIEDNKPDCIEKMTAACVGTAIRVCVMETKYPQGGEKQLIHALTGRMVPSGGLPMDAGAVVINVSTAAAVSDAVRWGRPITDRIVTVTGAVMQPQNIRVRIGVSIGSVLEQCGGVRPEANRLVLGGPMMGMAAYHPETPVVKGTGGILLLAEGEADQKPLSNCIRCASCVGVCPIGLMPLKMYALAKAGRMSEAKEKFHLLDCIECGCCSYSCPARLPLVHEFRMAKRALKRKGS